MAPCSALISIFYSIAVVCPRVNEAAAAFILCASGHNTPNKWMAGKTTYFKTTANSDTQQQSIFYYYSYNHPPEVPITTYIFEDISLDVPCWSFGTTDNDTNIVDGHFSEFGLSHCVLFLSLIPSLCICLQFCNFTILTESISADLQFCIDLILNSISFHSQISCVYTYSLSNLQSE